jgi:hypothetical protein
MVRLADKRAAMQRAVIRDQRSVIESQEAAIMRTTS